MELGFRHAEVRFFISNCVQEQVHKKQNLPYHILPPFHTT